MNFTTVLAFVKARASEPSSLAAAAGLAAMFGFHVDPTALQGVADGVSNLVAGVASVAAFVAMVRKG